MAMNLKALKDKSYSLDKPAKNYKKTALNGYIAVRPEDLRTRDWDKFWSYVDESEGHILWQGTMQRGRPTFRFLRRRISPARMLKILAGAIDTKDTVVLQCSEQRCLSHVRVYTPAQYSARLTRIVNTPPQKVF